MYGCESGVCPQRTVMEGNRAMGSFMITVCHVNGRGWRRKVGLETEDKNSYYWKS